MAFSVPWLKTWHSKTASSQDLLSIHISITTVFTLYDSYDIERMQKVMDKCLYLNAACVAERNTSVYDPGGGKGNATATDKAQRLEETANNLLWLLWQHNRVKTELWVQFMLYQPLYGSEFQEERKIQTFKSRWIYESHCLLLNTTAEILKDGTYKQIPVTDGDRKRDHNASVGSILAILQQVAPFSSLNIITLLK